jgi:hypothetical protein
MSDPSPSALRAARAIMRAQSRAYQNVDSLAEIIARECDTAGLRAELEEAAEWIEDAQSEALASENYIRAERYRKAAEKARAALAKYDK